MNQERVIFVPSRVDGAAATAYLAAGINA